VQVIGGCCGTTPEFIARLAAMAPNLTPHRAPSSTSRRWRRSTRPVPLAQDTSFLMIGERTNANGSKKFREAMLDGDYDTCTAMATEQVKRRRPRARRVRRLRGPRRHRRHGRDRQPLRHPGQRAAGARLHRARGHRGRPAVDRRPRHPQLRQPRGRRGRGVAPRPGVQAGQGVRRRGDLPAHRRGGPGPRRRVEDAGGHRIARARRGPLRPGAQRPHLRRAHLPAVHRRRRPAPDAMATIEAIRRIKAEIPGRATPRSACRT
jgi:hypothetical protein